MKLNLTYKPKKAISINLKITLINKLRYKLMIRINLYNLKMKNELKLSMITLGILLLSSCASTNNITNEANTLLEQGDQNKDGALSFDETWLLLKNDTDDRELAKKKGLTHKELVRQNFEKADKNKDGKISKYELISSLKDD